LPPAAAIIQFGDHSLSPVYSAGVTRATDEVSTESDYTVLTATGSDWVLVLVGLVCTSA
jgi:hypothetical protein